MGAEPTSGTIISEIYVHLTLTRYSVPAGTLGELVVPELEVMFLTVECPWAGNRPFVSCVPSGEYRLVREHFNKYGRRWALVGDTVSLFRSVKQRYACLFHAANRPSQLAGCVAPGLVPYAGHHEWGVGSSARALAELEEILEGEDEHTLTIRWVDPGVLQR